MSITENSFAATVAAEDAGTRLDRFLSEKIPGWSRSRLKSLFDDGLVLVNGEIEKPSYRLRPGDEINAELHESDENAFEPEPIPLEIVFEDEYLAVINKPAGMVVHPGAGVSSGTLANAIAYHFDLETNGDDEADRRVGIVHRLDKDTSGLIVVAKNRRTQEMLSRMFGKREVEKSYLALVHGYVRRLSGKIDRPIGRDRRNRVKMAVSEDGRRAVSTYRVERRFEKFTLLNIEIKTGRTHQIRVHLASINHPIVGDKTYNEGRDNSIADQSVKRAVEGLGRFFLHAARLAFSHPVTKQRLELVQPLPVELKNLIEAIG